MQNESKLGIPATEPVTNAIAASLGECGTARAEEGGAIVLTAYDDDYNLIAIRAARVGEHGVEAGKTYRLSRDGAFEAVESDADDA